MLSPSLSMPLCLPRLLLFSVYPRSPFLKLPSVIMSIDPLGATLGVLGLAGTVLDLMQYGFVAKDREDEVRVQTDKLRLESVLFHLWTEDVFLNRSWDQPHDQVKVFLPRFCKI